MCFSTFLARHGELHVSCITLYISIAFEWLFLWFVVSDEYICVPIFGLHNVTLKMWVTNFVFAICWFVCSVFLHSFFFFLKEAWFMVVSLFPQLRHQSLGMRLCKTHRIRSNRIKQTRNTHIYIHTNTEMRKDKRIRFFRSKFARYWRFKCWILKSLSSS